MAQQSRLTAFIAELRRRRDFRVSAVYAGVAFVIIQIIHGAFSYLRIPEWVGTTVIVPVLIGFLISIGLAWAFDITPEGIVRTVGRRTGKPGTSNRALIAVTILAVAFGIWGRWGGGTHGTRSNVIAVLPLENMGANEFEYCADGLTDDLISELAPTTDLSVISRTSVMQDKDSRKTIKEIGMPQENHRG